MPGQTKIYAIPAAFLLWVIVPAVCAQETGLKTRSGTEIGATVSHYRYEEPSLGVKLEGYKGGLDLSVFTNPGGDWFIHLQGRYEYGKTDYTGSGTKNGNPDWYYELRAMFGKDFDRGTFSLSPFIGLGFRYLYNDLRGVTSTGAVGYTRESQYSYIPIGVTHRIRLESKARLATTLEADYLIQGRQTSTLSDVSPILGDVTNDQRDGYGIRGSVFYETDKWLFGPWVQYWHTNRSDLAPVLATIGGVTFIIGTAFEPTNKTTEIGLRLGYRF